MADYTKLQARWSKREKDIVFSYPTSADGALLNMILCAKRQRHDYTLRAAVFEPSFVEELENRGYDIKTLRFSVRLKEKGGPDEG